MRVNAANEQLAFLCRIKATPRQNRTVKIKLMSLVLSAAATILRRKGAVARNKFTRYVTAHKVVPRNALACLFDREHYRRNFHSTFNSLSVSCKAMILLYVVSASIS